MFAHGKQLLKSVFSVMRKRVAVFEVAVLIILILALAADAHADAGLPLIVIIWPAFWLALIPVIAIEIFYLEKISGKTKRELIWPVTTANLFSTLLGYPIAWLILLGIDLAVTGTHPIELRTFWQSIGATIIQSAWLAPDEKGPRSVIPIALTVNFLVAYLVSWYSEGWILSKMLHQPFSRAGRWSRNANFFSYLFLIIMLVGMGYYGPGILKGPISLVERLLEFALTPWKK